MSGATFQDHDDPHSTVYKVPDYSAKRILVDSVRRSLTSIKIRSADKYNDRTHDLLQQFGDVMPTRDKNVIEAQLDEIELLEEKLDNTRSLFQRIPLSLEYRRVARETYLITKKASNRIRNSQSKSKVGAAPSPEASPTPTPAGEKLPTDITRHPFNARGRASFHDVSFHHVERVELTTLQSRTTGDPLVLVQLHETNQRTREYVAGLPPFPPDDNMTDAGDRTRLSLPDAAETSTINSGDVIGDVE